MATTGTADEKTSTDDATLDAMIVEDPNEPGRHYARLTDKTHVWVVLATLRRTGGDIATAMQEWRLSEDAVRAAIRYYERHRAIFDAFFLLQQEEDEALDRA